MTVTAALLILRSANIRDVYYIFLLDNTPSIKKHGILSFNEVKRRGIPNRSFALSGPQALRDTFVVPLCDGTCARLHDLVPLYFNPCNPTLIRRRDLWADMAIAVIPLANLLPRIKAWTVADGNAASPKTYYITKTDELLKRLDLKLLRADSWTRYPGDPATNKRRRCAELLVAPSVPVNAIAQVVVYERSATAKVQDHFPVTVDPSLFKNGPFSLPLVD